MHRQGEGRSKIRTLHLNVLNASPKQAQSTSRACPATIGRCPLCPHCTSLCGLRSVGELDGLKHHAIYLADTTISRRPMWACMDM